jgi:hypothetical protein
LRAPWIVALASLVGCFGQKSTEGLPCDFDSQCDLGQACVDMVCVESADTDPTGCMPAEVELAPIPPRVVIVVDRSAAMADPWDDDGEPGSPEVERWPNVVAALAGELQEIDGAVELGLALAPGAAAACGVDEGLAVPLAPQAASDVIAALPAAAQGGLPIGGALSSAVAALAQSEGAPRAIVLVVAGAPGCFEGDGDAFDGGAETVVASALADGVPTVVVGVAPSEVNDDATGNERPDGIAAAATTSALAMAGGRPRGDTGDYRADNGVTLRPTVQDALFTARECALPRPEGLDAPSDVALSIDGQTVPRLEACDGSGFVVGDAALQVCGDWCSALKLSGMAVATIACE